MTPSWPVHLLRNPDAAAHGRIALVSVEPASQPEQILVRLATGPRRNALAQGTAYGPFAAAEVHERVAYVLERLHAAGYRPLTPHSVLIEQLRATSRRQRALAAQNLGWRRSAEAVPALLDAAAQAQSELPVILDALGRIGDPAAVPLCREHAGKKLLSRRRSGVEALRLLGDSEGLAQARLAGLERLPPEIRTLLAQLDESDSATAEVESLSSAVLALEPLRRGLVLDQLYEFATPLCVAAVCRALRQDWWQAHLWRYTKSIWKRAMLRMDARTFALIVHQVDSKRGQLAGSRAELKSGLDGQSRKTRVYSARTQAWVQRASARWLRRIAYWRREQYAGTAARLLRRYSGLDAREPRGLAGPFAHALVLHRILHAAGPRFRIDASGRVLARSAQALTQGWDASHVPFLDRWQAQPQAFLQLAAFAQLPELRAWGQQELLKQPELLSSADTATLALLVDAEPALAFRAEAEVERRSSDTQVPLTLAAALLDAGVRARTLAARLLLAGGAPWFASADVVLLLRRHTASGRDAAAQIAAQAFDRHPAAIGHTVLQRLLDALATPKANAERDSALVTVLQAQARPAAALLSLEQVLAWIQDGDLNQRTVAGALLSAHPDALSMLGTARLVALADDEVQSVRAAVCALVSKALELLRVDPWPLLTLAETRFPDTRRCAFELLSRLDIAALELPALVALCDSNHAQVQRYARDWIGGHLEHVDAAALLQHLVEHPHVPMRSFALELLESHLPAGSDAFAAVAGFLRSSLLTPRMPRAAKDRLIRVVEQRGLVDPEQARVALEILGAALRTRVQSDFEPLVLALSRLQLRYPDIEGDWQLGSRPA